MAPRNFDTPGPEWSGPCSLPWAPRQIGGRDTGWLPTRAASPVLTGPFPLAALSAQGRSANTSSPPTVRYPNSTWRRWQSSHRNLPPRARQVKGWVHLSDLRPSGHPLFQMVSDNSTNFSSSPLPLRRHCYSSPESFPHKSPLSRTSGMLLVSLQLEWYFQSTNGISIASAQVGPSSTHTVHGT